MNSTTQKCKLGVVAKISAGQTFRGKAEADYETETRLIQIKDITKGYLDRIDNLGYANIRIPDLKIRLYKNNILMPLRGNRQASLLYDADDKFITTTTNHVAILAPNTERILPSYLLWTLNTQFFNDQLSRLKTGTTISQLSIKRLVDIPIKLPTIDIQEEIVSISDNWNSQKEILNELIINGEELSERLCLEKISNTGT